MDLIVNGEKLQTKKDISLYSLIKDLKIENKVMAAAVNMQIIKKDKWDKFILKENDKIELLQFVGGG